MRKNSIAALAILGIVLASNNSAYGASMTFNEAMSLTATLEGYASVLLGLQDEIGFGAGENLDWDIEFSSSGATFSSTGFLDESPLTLNYSGTLTGNPGVEDLTWSGNWSGSLGSNSITATDTATFLLSDNDGVYTTLNFEQAGSASPGWGVAAAETLIGGAVGGVVSGWNPLGIIGGANAGLAFSNVAFDDEPPPLPDPPPAPDPDDPNVEPGQEIIIITGSNNQVNKSQNPESGPIINIQGDWNCENGCSANGALETIPEPLTILGSGLALGLGAYFKKEYSKKQKKTKAKA